MTLSQARTTVYDVRSDVGSDGAPTLTEHAAGALDGTDFEWIADADPEPAAPVIFICWSGPAEPIVAMRRRAAEGARW